MNSGTGSVTYFFLATLDTKTLASFNTDSQGSCLSIRTGLERVGEVTVEATRHPFFVGWKHNHCSQWSSVSLDFWLHWAVSMSPMTISMNFFFSSKISRHFFLIMTWHYWRKNTPDQIRAFWGGKTALDVATLFLTYVGGSSFVWGHIPTLYTCLLQPDIPIREKSFDTTWQKVRGSQCWIQI